MVAMRRGLLNIVLGGIVVVAACGGSASPSSAPSAPSQTVTPTATASPTPSIDVRAADGRLTTDLFYAHSVAWYQGTDAGIDAILADVYPPMLTAPDYKLSHAECVQAYFGSTPAARNYQVNSVPDLATLQPSDGFTLPQGSLAGKTIDGRIYSVTIHQTTSAQGLPAQNSSATVHVTIISGRAYHFTSCATS